MIEPDRSSEADESLCLSGEVDSYAAAELHGKLGAYLAGSTRPRVDVSGLQACDILSLQLLYSAAASVPSELRTQLFSPFPECLMKSCVELGLPLPSQEPAASPLLKASL